MLKAWTLARAAPASRSRPSEAVGGRSALPGRKVSRVATVPLALPSRSAAISRGAARPWAYEELLSAQLDPALDLLERGDLGYPSACSSDQCPSVPGRTGSGAAVTGSMWG